MEKWFKKVLDHPILGRTILGGYMVLWFGGILALIVFTSDGPVYLTWLVLGVLVIASIFDFGQLAGSKGMKDLHTEELLNTKLGEKGEATWGFIIDEYYKDIKKGLYTNIIALVIFLLLNIIGLWSHILNWLSELYGVQIW
tara:strand:+ start:629 stop:1051 length:423 start_codon:yes stop_codon:yes gene_type:complete